MEFYFDEYHDSQIVEKLLPHSGHFCRRKLKLSWPNLDTRIGKIVDSGNTDRFEVSTALEWLYLVSSLDWLLFRRWLS